MVLMALGPTSSRDGKPLFSTSRTASSSDIVDSQDLPAGGRMQDGLPAKIAIVTEAGAGALRLDDPRQFLVLDDGEADEFAGFGREPVEFGIRHLPHPGRREMTEADDRKAKGRKVILGFRVLLDIAARNENLEKAVGGGLAHGYPVGDGAEGKRPLRCLDQFEDIDRLVELDGHG